MQLDLGMIALTIAIAAQSLQAKSDVPRKLFQ
jgi:hypothetical protein